MAGWGAFKSNLVVFQLCNDYVIRNGLYEIHTSGVVQLVPSGEDEDDISRFLPREVYVWDRRSRRFDHIEGRLTYKQGLLTSIYSDLADPEGDWFTKPRVIDREERSEGFQEEQW